MTVDPHRPSRPAPVRIAEADGQHAVLAFSGDLDSHGLRVLEELLLDHRLREPGTWTLEMSDLHHIDLACAYALLRAVTRAPEPAAITVRGARPAVHRTLRHAGLDTVATFEE
ncbi:MULTISPECIES: STAS domain-containing protein [unclassified Streptomyces]|uniref:STAS domain-containing protein n=1 Tax=unclassified Streptomyces TaxID=2593676 RepID=UPI0028773555|nr:STAS domain-containing protein [Streptomyces sp. BB1-1-1]WND34249.1 STAS domain-containing protein [Streptomyces sp. BB1-1-1]